MDGISTLKEEQKLHGGIFSAEKMFLALLPRDKLQKIDACGEKESSVSPQTARAKPTALLSIVTDWGRLVADRSPAAGTEIALFFFFFPSRGIGASTARLIKWPARVSSSCGQEDKTPTSQRAAFTRTVAPRLHLAG